MGAPAPEGQALGLPAPACPRPVRAPRVKARPPGPTASAAQAWTLGEPAIPAGAPTRPERSADKQESIAGSQYTSITFTQRLAETGIDSSMGSVGDAYDNALAESVIGLFKTELINPGGPWRTVEQVKAATLHYVHWFNHHRLLEVNGDLPPIELEQTYYRLHHSDLAEAG